MNAPARRPVQVRIERLVLHGLPLGAAPGRRLQASLARELARLIAAQGRETARGVRTEPEREPALVWDSARPAALGRALARRVFAALPPLREAP